MNAPTPGVTISEELKAAGCTRAWVEAVITRVDGTVEDLGVVSDSNMNPASA